MSDPSSVAGWFERAYATGRTPWATLSPDQRLVEWARDRPAGGWALVVGCGLGDDAVLLAGLGWEVVAFDVSRSAIQSARGRFPGSQITYLVADGRWPRSPPWSPRGARCSSPGSEGRGSLPRASACPPR